VRAGDAEIRSRIVLLVVLSPPLPFLRAPPCPPPRCPPLTQYYSSERDDNFLIGSEIHLQDALNANYTRLRIEGFQALGPVPPPQTGWYRWPRQPPSSCPFANSTDIVGIEFNMGVNYQYGHADT
jgi:hypothetical protein